MMRSMNSAASGRTRTVSLLGGLALQCVSSVMTPTPAHAEDSILTIARDSLYGAATGLLLGGVLALVVDADSRDDSIRWGVVVGTFAGCAFGIWQVAHPEEFSLRPRTAPTDPALAHTQESCRRLGDLPLGAPFSGDALRRVGHGSGGGTGPR